jgi:hypothetical protein
VSVFPILPLLLAAAAVAVACTAVRAARRTRRELAAVRRELAAAVAAVEPLPAARTAEQAERAADEADRAAEIRAAVAEALAEERERELAEARAFWAAHEAQEASGAPGFDPVEAGGLPAEDDGYDPRPGYGEAAEGDGPEEDQGPGDAAYLDLEEFQVLPLLPRQVDRLGDPDAAGPPRFRHPSDPDFVPSPVVADPEQTVARLAELAEAGIPLADVRPGPLGTLDLYIFTDGTTLCLTPGHSEPADRLAAALDRGESPVLMGGSGISGAYTLTFTYGTESVFILADRVVASL